MMGPDEVIASLAKDFTNVPDEVQQLYGIIPRAISAIFMKINEFVSEGHKVGLTMSFLEIYNEDIKCLLSEKDKLKIRQVPGLGFVVPEKGTVICKEPETIFENIVLANERRKTASTKQNDRSSRSHTVLMLDFEYKGLDGLIKKSTLNLVDLAGSERISKTEVTGQNLKEAQKINQSLTTLGMCIMALSTNANHVPFRNSKLTLILRESLGGNSKTTLVCTCSKKKHHSEESIQTLHFASRAKTIVCKAKSNVTMGVKELTELIAIMKTYILELRGQVQSKGESWLLKDDPKILEFLTNEEFIQYGTSEFSSNLKSSRSSIAGLSEDEIVKKYIDLRIRYEKIMKNTTDDLESNLNIVHSQKEALKEYDETMKFELDQLHKQNEEKLLQLIKEKQDLEGKNKELEETLFQEIQEFEEKTSSLIQDKANLEKLVSELRSQFDQVSSEIEGMQTQIDAKHREASELMAVIDLNKKEIETKNSIIEDKSNQLSDKENKINVLSSSLTEKENQLAITTAEKEQKDSEVHFANETLKKKVEELKTINEKVKELTLNEIDLNSKLQQLSTELQNKEKQFQVLEEKQRSDISELEALLNGSKEKNRELETILKQKVSDQDLLAKSEKILSDARIELFDENAKLKQDFASKEEEVKALNKKIEALSAEYNQQETTLKKEICSLEAEIENLKGQLSSNLAEHNEALKNKEIAFNALQSQLTFKDEENRKLLDMNSEKDKTNDQLRTEIEKVVSKVDALESALGVSKENEESLKREIKSVKERIEKSSVENKKLFNDLENERTEEIKKLQQSLKVCEQKLTEKNQEISVLRQASDNNVLELTKSQSKNNILKLENKIVKRQSKIKSFESPEVSHPVELKKNIFGVVLKSTAASKKFIKEAHKENKKIEEESRKIFVDQLDRLKDLRNQVANSSPRTLSSRSLASNEMVELDFQDEELFLEYNTKMAEKEKEYVFSKNKD